MMRKMLGCAALIGAVAPGIAGAQDISYNYVDGGLALYPSADNSQDFAGLDANGRFAVTDDVFVLGGFQYLTDDIDYTAFHVGGGYRFAIDPDTDMWGGLTIEYQEFDWPGSQAFGVGSFDDTSLGLRGGVRHRLNQDLELSGEVRIVTGDLDYVGFRGTVQYFLQEDLGLVGSVDIFDGNLGLIGGARVSF
ncbi:hypothetical protein ACNSTU_16690 [Aquisalimonas sp. APHAB1-3]|uniref:hypothetical protein n=1 Tax=Aquisalimonas sp. APHAB1-3 TaxID=3402080 RepID=UPI003AAD6B1D